MSRALALLVLSCFAAGCGDEEVDTGDGVQCGSPVQHDLTVTGVIKDGSGAAVVGASVILEDQGYTLGTELGAATTEAGGRFSIAATGVTAMDNCWGTVLRYALVAEEGERSGEKIITTYIHGAIDDGSLEADVSDFPLVIE